MKFQESAPKNHVLCVDLDGTLIKSDMLLETFLLLAFKSPLKLVLIPFWLLKGRAYLKKKIANLITFDPAVLPYNKTFFDFLKQKHASGSKIILTTASDQSIADSIAIHLGIFDQVIGSNGAINRIGSKKLSIIKEHYDTFDYAGNEIRDLKLWREAKNSIIVSNKPWLVNRLKKIIKFSNEFVEESNLIKNVLKALRVHQWVKNLLLLLPLFLAHKFQDYSAILDSGFAFFSFCFCASAFYIFNDLSDLNSDRQHPTKKNRPFASGDLSIGTGIMMVPILLGISILLALKLPGQFFNALIIYAILTGLYSSYFKKIVVLDVVILSSFYTIRLFAGALAVNVQISQWLLAFSMFMFLSLAFAKRFSELYAMRERKQSEAKGRGYVSVDLEQVSQLGSASGYISVLVMVLYVNSSEVTALYSSPKLLWLICPLLLYWIGRVLDPCS